MKRFEVTERLPNAERERLLEAVLFGMAMADKAIRESLDPTDFTYPLAAIVEEIQKPKPETWKLNGWLLDALSVERSNGTKVTDACLARLKHNADLREMQKRHGLDGVFAKLALLSQERKRTAQLQRDYRAWQESERQKRLDAAKASGVSPGQEPAASGLRLGITPS
jgi:hypothetical protein